MNIKEKIKVFISSKCGVDKYNIVREALKCRLEDTGFIDTYVFESTGAYSKTAIDAYLSKLDDCDLVIFLIDNEDEKFPEGVMKEYIRAKDLQKKSIYLFLNTEGIDETSIQKSLYGPNGAKFDYVYNIKEFIDKGYQSIIEDIFTIYKDYCRDRLHNITLYEEKESTLGNDKVIVFNEIEKYRIKKSVISNFSNVYEYFKRKNKFYRGKKLKSNSDIENAFIYFAKLVLCEEQFKENEIGNLINLIIDSHTDINKEIVRKKLESIKYCYDGNLKGAICILEEAYTEGEKVQIAEWILNDILIDKRSLECLLNQETNEFKEVDAQKCLDTNESVLYYPVLDRLSKDIYNNIMNERNKIDMSNPYTTSIGTGIDKSLEKVGEYFIWAVYYGSYTHIKIVVRLLEDIFYNYYKIYNVNEWGFLALKYSILNGSSKVTKDICDRNSNVISLCSMEKIDLLYEMADNADRNYNKVKLKVDCLKNLGYYFSDEKYLFIEKAIFNIFNEWIYSDDRVWNLGQDIFESIKENVNRINIRNTFDFFNTVFNKKYCRFYDDIFKIVTLIPNEKINDEMIEEMISIIIDIVKDEGKRTLYNNLKYCIIYLRKISHKFSDTLDELINNYWGEIKEIYILEISDDIDVYYKSILKYVEEIKNRNLVQGNWGYHGYGYKPADVIKNILEISKLNILDKYLLEKITEASRECIMSEKQTVLEKISCIQLIIYLKGISINDNIIFDWNNYNSLLQEEKVLKGYSDDFINKSSKLTLLANYITYKIINSNGDEKDLLELLSYYNDDNAYENINIIEAINSMIDNSVGKRIGKDIYMILLQFISRYVNDKNYEVRYRVVNCLFKFMNKIENDIIYKYIERISNDLDYRVKLCILNNIEKYNKKDTYKYIIEKYSVDNNYLVRARSKSIFDL